MGGRKDCNLLCWSSRLYGTSFESTNWRSLDPCGLAGISCSFGVHVFAFSTIAAHLIEGSLFSTTVFLLIYTPIAILAVSSLYMAWSTDPGGVPMGARPLVTVKRAPCGEIKPTTKKGGRQRAMRRCPKCNDNYKPDRAHHDSVTGRCIVKFDHFCPWVGNAVGALNHKFFVLFVGYTMWSCLISLVLIFVRTVHCGWVEDDDDSSDHASATLHETNNAGGDEISGSASYDQDGRLLETQYREECMGYYNSYATLILLIISIAFLIFTCCMLFDQVEAIETNASKIARMKMRVGQAGTELSRVTEEFNEMFGGDSNNVSWHWFLPIPVEFPRGMKKVVLGYEWDETFDAVPYEDPSSRSGSSDVHGRSISSGLSVGGAIGLSGDVEEGSGVELTPQSSRNSSTSPSPIPSNGSAIMVEDPSFQDDRRPSLKQRGNSRGPDSRLKTPPSATLT